MESVSVSATAGKPEAPSGVVRTTGLEEVSLTWDDSTENDFAGYNVYAYDPAAREGDVALSSKGASVLSAVRNPRNNFV